MTVRAVFKPPPRPLPRPVSRAARLIALAHHVERLVEAGVVESYAVAARELGLTRARLSQVLALPGLGPEVQERVLRGNLELTDHALRPLVAEVEWQAQGRLTGEDP